MQVSSWEHFQSTNTFIKQTVVSARPVIFELPLLRLHLLGDHRIYIKGSPYNNEVGEGSKKKEDIGGLSHAAGIPVSCWHASVNSC